MCLCLGPPSQLSGSVSIQEVSSGGKTLIKVTYFGTSLYVFKIRKLVNLIWEIGLNGTSFCFSDLLIFDNMDVSKVRQFGCEIQLDLEPF